MTATATDRAVLFTSGELATRLGARLLGPSDTAITGLEALHAAGPGDLSFLRDGRYLEALVKSKCAAALVSEAKIDTAAAHQLNPSRALIIVKDADAALIGLLEMLSPKFELSPGRHPSAVVDPSAKVSPAAQIGPNVVIAAGASVGDGTVLGPGVSLAREVRVGRGCVLHAHVAVQHDCVIGDGCILHPGVVIGADGFGYRPAPDGRSLVKIPHIGNVVVEPGVEIGANSCIDRGKFGATRIGAGTKIDNLVQIGHNCTIGRCCIICGCCAVAGSVTLGDGVTLAGGVGIADGRTIGARATIAGRSGVMDDVPAGETWFGYPARPSRQMMRLVAAQDRLPDIMSQVRRMMKDAGA